MCLFKTVALPARTTQHHNAQSVVALNRCIRKVYGKFCSFTKYFSFTRACANAQPARDVRPGVPNRKRCDSLYSCRVVWLWNIIFCTTKYYSTTTLYYSRTTPYYSSSSTSTSASSSTSSTSRASTKGLLGQVKNRKITAVSCDRRVWSCETVAPAGQKSSNCYSFVRSTRAILRNGFSGRWQIAKLLRSYERVAFPQTFFGPWRPPLLVK